MKTLDPTRKLLRKLDRTLTALVAEKVKEADFTPAMEEAAENAGFGREAEQAIERACENYDFDTAIEEAVRDFDFSDAIEKHADLEGEAEKAVEKALENYDLDEKVGEILDAKLEQKLPGVVEKVLLSLLEKPEVAEKFVRVLFDRAAA